jgi:DNA modification methylase
MTAHSNLLEDTRRADALQRERFGRALRVNSDLDRTLVSFQANKAKNGHRWCKYKEGFSAALMHYVFEKVAITSGRILDPFAGSGTALFVASDRGIDAVGIELLPSSAEIIEVRRLLGKADRSRVAADIREFRLGRVWEKPGNAAAFPHIKITAGAFPEEAELALGRYLFEASRLDDPELGRVLRFAALCVLESISYTRKDGQYLRWDARSGRRVGTKPFDKGRILSFTEAITDKLDEISGDLSGDGVLLDLLHSEAEQGEIELLIGSCLDILPNIEAQSFDGIVTSPPYCNRYDYTRTYALELAMMGIGEAEIRGLRQTMLSCTVENRDKVGLEGRFPNSTFSAAKDAWASQGMLQSVLAYLESCRRDGSINNTGIPRMVRNYFLEMALVIFECSRVLKPGAPFVMVNDNVRYQGAHVPVDLILSDFAEQAGFETQTIWVLPRGKGNSSQQMATHGREELRKCVYVWRRLTDQPPSPRDRVLAEAL